MVTDAQVRKLMDEMSKHGRIGIAALRSGMHRNTAHKYAEAGKTPSQLRQPRTWRTREDPFVEDLIVGDSLLDPLYTRASSALSARALARIDP